MAIEELEGEGAGGRQSEMEAKKEKKKERVDRIDESCIPTFFVCCCLFFLDPIDPISI